MRLESVRGAAVALSERVEGLSDEAVLIRIHKSYAHPGGVYVYRITWRGKSIVYATDTEGYIGTDRKLVAFARRCGCVDPRRTIFWKNIIGGNSLDFHPRKDMDTRP